MDAHHVPPQLQNLLMVVVGNKWPTGDETALRREAAAWWEAASAIRACVQDVAEVHLWVDAGLEGSTREAIDTFLIRLVGSAGDEGGAVLPAIARCCEDAADALDALANEIETLRILITGALAVLAVQLMVDMTALALFGGPAAAAAHITATRVLCLTFLRRAVIHALTRVGESVLAQVGFTLLAQVIELAQHHRRSLGGSQLRVAAANGAVGGTVGFGAGMAGGALARGVGGGARLAGLGARGRGAAQLVWQGGFGALAGMAEGAAQDAVFGLSGDWVSGAANGSFNGVWGARHTGMNPRNLGSISPADHLEVALDGLPHPPRQTHGSGSTHPQSTDAPPPVNLLTSSTGTPRPTDPSSGDGSGPEGPEVWHDAVGPHQSPPRDFVSARSSFASGGEPRADSHPAPEDFGDPGDPQPSVSQHAAVPPDRENPHSHPGSEVPRIPTPDQVEEILNPSPPKTA